MPKIEVSQEKFDQALEDLLDEMSGAEILATPGAYEVFSEALNNEAIVRAIKSERREGPPMCSSCGRDVTDSPAGGCKTPKEHG